MMLLSHFFFYQLHHNKLILGDLNVHHRQWGSLRCDIHGDQRVNILLQTNFSLRNDGSKTRTGNVSSIDSSVASPGIHRDFIWGTFEDSLRSNHLPTCISYSSDFTPSHSPQKFNFKKADLASFSRIIDLDISRIDVDGKIDAAQHSILQAAHATIMITFTVHTTVATLWWTPDY